MKDQEKSKPEEEETNDMGRPQTNFSKKKIKNNYFIVILLIVLFFSFMYIDTGKLNDRVNSVKATPK